MSTSRKSDKIGVHDQKQGREATMQYHVVTVEKEIEEDEDSVRR